jgi:hypothetical protein
MDAFRLDVVAASNIDLAELLERMLEHEWLR